MDERTPGDDAILSDRAVRAGLDDPVVKVIAVQIVGLALLGWPRGACLPRRLQRR
jgi:hypothetical protein